MTIEETIEHNTPAIIPYLHQGELRAMVWYVVEGKLQGVIMNTDFKRATDFVEGYIHGLRHHNDFIEEEK